MAGVVPSETGCEEGRDMVARAWKGLKSPGDETGVLLAVCACGGCRVVSLEGVALMVESEGGVCSIVGVASWTWIRASCGRRDAVVTERHHGLKD